MRVTIEDEKDDVIVLDDPCSTPADPRFADSPRRFSALEEIRTCVRVCSELAQNADLEAHDRMNAAWRAVEMIKIAREALGTTLDT